MNALYGYIITRLLNANLRGTEEGLLEATRLMSELSSAWRTIGEVTNGDHTRNTLPA